MKHRLRGAAGRRFRDRGWAGCLLAAACLLLAVTACAPTVIQGRAASMLYDPDRVGGLRANGGFSGVPTTHPRREVTSSEPTAATTIGLPCWRSTTLKNSGQ
jgi:hypothetical protein